MTASGVKTWLIRIFKKERKRYPLKPKGDCFTEEAMGCVLEETLTREDMKVFQKHLATCALCMKLLKRDLFLSRGFDPALLILSPQHLIDWAKVLARPIVD